MPNQEPPLGQADDSAPSAEQALRRRAEEIAQTNDVPAPEALAGLASEAARQVLHELQVHQIELEMQNEELRRTQVELEASQARYFDLYDLAPVGYFTLSERGLILEANLTAAGLLGVARSALVKQPLSHFIFPEDHDIYYRRRRQLATKSAPQVFELRMKRAAGAPFWVRVEATAVRTGDPSAPVYRAVISDITARKQAEEAQQETNRHLEATLTELQAAQAQIIQQERLAAIGQLAAGIAHDFNDILTVIALHAYLGLHTHNVPPELHERFATVALQAKSAADLVQQILDFARRSVIQTRLLDLGPFLTEQVDLLRRLMPESISIDLSHEMDECVIRADPTRIQQVLTNLALNARDAMPHGGKLRIRLQLLRIARDQATPLPDMEAGEWIQITVSDTGTGIAPEVLPHLFEPYITTKDSGKGSGLGLAQVYGIVKQQDGHIAVQTQAGEGTTFTIYLPSVVVAPPVGVPAAPASSPQGQGETILVVEDNATLRKMLVHILETLNYRTLAAANGRAALAILEREAGEIALVLSDMMMPEMDGLELFQALTVRGLPLPMVILSGYPMEVELQALYAQGLAGWLLKPPGIEQLAVVLAQALHKAAR